MQARRERTDMASQGPLSGVRILELMGIGPAPFCGMLLADLGADVVVVDRVQRNKDDFHLESSSITNRNKRIIRLDLKSPEGIETLLELATHSDALIEGMRPGVMERLGIGPEVLLERNPKLVFGRMTGWGQGGPLAHAAGHDLNYLALSGALWYSGQPGEPPLSPPSVIGDVGGGALYLAVGLLSAIMHVRNGGQGQVVDAAIVDGSAHMLSLLLDLKAIGQFVNERGKSILDGPHWYSTYRCADGEYISIGALEPKFYEELLRRLDLEDDPDFANHYDASCWPELKYRLSKLFAQHSREHWRDLLEGSDACFAPVLNVDEAASNDHMAARGIYIKDQRGCLQPAPAPRFSVTQTTIPTFGRSAQTSEILEHWRDSH